MTFADNNRWHGQSESQTLEFKSSVDVRAIAEAICGMLNAEGGVIAIGVANDGSLVGIENAEFQAEELDMAIRKRISPLAPWSVMNTEADGVSIILVDVPSGSRKPYVIDGKVFVRVGEANRPAAAEDINRLIQQRIKSDQDWERQPAIGVSTSDFDAAEIEKMIRQSVEAGRFDSSVTNPEDVLMRLNLVIDGRPIQAAVVAFGSDLLPWYPQCSLRIARFKGVTKDEVLDQRKVSGHAFLLLDEASKFLAKQLPIRGTLQEGQLRRQDRPLYPILALREALVNALCHRDYSISGGAVSVAVFEDRLEIASTGSLPNGLSVADLKRDHFSQPRNPMLADIFYRRGLIELWGSGTQRIIRLCVEAGGPEPQFEERAGEFVVRFLAPNYAPSVPSGLDLSDRQARILAIFQSNPVRSLREIRESIDANLSDSTIRGELNRLREVGLVEAVGVGRGAFWRRIQWPDI
ncbi:MAG: putative DNA binding domain-containing protein [Pirellula sp.]|nr:putative DNA binding domain-containing protein [Pirellula sp.]